MPVFIIMDSQLHDMLFERHSIRKYTNTPIDSDHVKQILEAALLAPSSKSARPWLFVVVEDRATLEALAGCKKVGSRPLAKCALAIVVVADPEKSDVYIEDASVAATMMHLQACALGVGSCWIQIRNRFNADNEPAANIVRSLLNIPDNLEPVCILSCGMPDEDRRAVDPEKLQWQKVHIGQWTDREL